jgi:hypothetical protein
VTDIEIQELQRAAALGRWGTNTGYLAAVNQYLCRMETPAWMARVWTVNLTAFRYAGGPLAVGGGTPDQQTTNAAQIALEWGVDGAGERCIMDYPWTGASFEVTCASLKLSFLGAGDTGLNAGGDLPNVGAFITPHMRGGSTEKNPPTLTRYVIVPQTSFANVPIPARARAYTLVARDNPSLLAAFQLGQQFGPTSFPTYSRIDCQSGFAGTGGAEPYASYPSATTGNFTISPICTSLHITNPTGAPTTYEFRFELDLG